MKRKISLILAAMLLVGTMPITNSLSVTAASSDGEAVASTTGADAFEFSDIVINLGATESEMNFVWYQNDSTPGTLLLARAADVVDGEMPEYAESFTATSTLAADGNYSNQVTATGLSANTEYAYQPTCGDNKADIYYFTTDGYGDFSFIYVADPQVNSSNGNREKWAATLEFIENTEVFDGSAFMLSAGDEVNQYTVSAGETIVGSEAEYDVYLNHDFMRKMPSMNVLGNHDVSERFNQHFHIANESTESTTMTKGNNNSYFVYNDVLFINVNGNVQSASKMAAQRAFVKEAVEAYPNAKWRVVITHQSMYGVAYHATEAYILNMRQNYIPIYDEFDIDIVLQGHDHVYCRTFLMENFVAYDDVSYYDDATYSSATDADGTIYITANSGTGTKFYDFAYSSGIMPFVAVQNQEHIPNVSKVFVSDNEFTVSTYRTSDGSLVDTFTLYKKAEATERLISLIDEEITLYSEEAIVAARESYDLLTDEQKDNVSNYDVLLAAEDALAEIKSYSPSTELGLSIANAPESAAPGSTFTADIVLNSAELSIREVSALNFTLDYDDVLTLDSIALAEGVSGQAFSNGDSFAWAYDAEAGGVGVMYQQPKTIAVATFTVGDVTEAGTASIGFDSTALLNIALADDEKMEGFTPDVRSAEIKLSIAKVGFVPADRYMALAADQKLLTVDVAEAGVNDKTYTVEYSDGTTETLYYSSRYDKYVTIIDASVSEAYIASALTATNEAAPELLYNGDVNGDGRCTAGDAAMISDMLHSCTAESKAADKPQYTDKMRLEADIFGTYDPDGEYVTVMDAVKTLLRAVGLI